MRIAHPAPVNEQQDSFSRTEVGLTHFSTDAFIKLSDNGDIEIFAEEGLGIIFHVGNKSITLIGDQVKFLTKEDNGLRWNQLAFNPQATKFTEPAFIMHEQEDMKDLYRGIGDYID